MPVHQPRLADIWRLIGRISHRGDYDIHPVTAAQIHPDPHSVGIEARLDVERKRTHGPIGMDVREPRDVLGNGLELLLQLFKVAAMIGR